MNDLQTAIRLSCLLEASARKAGNVHPGAAFEHLSYADFVKSGEAVAPVLAESATGGVGPTILAAVQQTRRVVEHNTNLGIILLIAPLAAVSRAVPIADGLPDVLVSLTQDDAEAVYEAIRIASPRGLGQHDSADVSESPIGTLREVMGLAADRDLIASEYVKGFPLVLNSASHLASVGGFGSDWEAGIQRLQLKLMADQPDTDIERKCGPGEAHESAVLAQQVLAAGFPETTAGRESFAAFDRWLRERGSQRNPGTTADLVTASLFVALRDDLIEPPSEAAIREHVERIVRRERP